MPKFPLIFFVCFSLSVSAQEQDTVITISEVQIDAYKKPSKLISSTKSVSVVLELLMRQNGPERMLEALNQNAGVRMEERSPGSYRLSVRGSTLRSPFGVRNVKVYLDDFILSDASGNTYLNAIAPQLISSMEVYKGPESGDYGAVTGGTVLLRTRHKDAALANLSFGSYGMFNQSVDFAKNFKKHFIQVFQTYYQTDSYREQSRVQRKQFFIKDHYQYASKGILKSMLLHSDLDYQTPGGLTLEQMLANPKQARLATATLPSAQEQDAGIRNKMTMLGVSNDYNFSPRISHFALIQASYVDFENPFITNFENRFENRLAWRTHFNYQKEFGKVNLEYRVGYEGGVTNFLVKNFDNNQGVEGAPHNFHKLKNASGFYFISQKLDVNSRFFSEIAVGLNYNSYNWHSLFPNQERGKVHFKKQWLPNLAATYLLGSGFSLRAKIGKGNSSPTNEEIRSSNQIINRNLEGEYGWNKEVGIRKQFGNSVYVEASYFDFRLQNTIVRRQNDAGAEYFINSGETKQKGLETTVESRTFFFKNPFFNSFRFRFSGNVYDFTFSKYQQNTTDYSGNDLTGVPKYSLSSILNFKFFKTFLVDYSHFYTSKMPLDDGNTVWANPTFIGTIRFSLPLIIDRTKIDVSLQVQNLYNEDYVLGYDLNAFGKRYYNPAPKRNWMLGTSIIF